MTELITPALHLYTLQSQADAEAFRMLNEEWIRLHFTLETKDQRTLGNPQGEILDKGGHVFLAELDGKPVACVALIPFGTSEYEISKMAVAPQARRQGIGRQMLQYAIDQARLMGATRLFLGSNTVLSNAVRLYESMGFQHVEPSELPYLGYARADVYMAYVWPDVNFPAADLTSAPAGRAQEDRSHG